SADRSAPHGSSARRSAASSATGIGPSSAHATRPCAARRRSGDAARRPTDARPVASPGARVHPGGMPEILAAVVRRLCPLLVPLVLAAAPAAQDVPQGPPAQVPAVTADTLEALVADLEDPARRAAFVERLRALIAVARGEAAERG